MPEVNRGANGKCIDIYVRYETHHRRQFDKALALLLKLRAETCKAAIGFVSQKQNEAQETRKTELHAVTLEIKNKRLERENPTRPSPESRLETN